MGIVLFQVFRFQVQPARELDVSVEPKRLVEKFTDVKKQTDDSAPVGRRQSGQCKHDRANGTFFIELKLLLFKF